MMVYKVLLKLLVVAAILSTALAWHVCQDEAFCRHLITRQPSKYAIQRDSIIINEKNQELKANLVNPDEDFNLKVTIYKNDILRVLIENNDATKRPIPSALVDNIPIGNAQFEIQNDHVVITGNYQEIKITIDDFQISSRNLITNDTIYVNKPIDLYVGDWLGLKVTFENMQNAYGIPQHAERLKLKDTKYTEPYRHFNVDYGAYKTESPESLYGSVPVLYAHGLRANGGENGEQNGAHVSGAFWHNPAQTFINLDHSNDDLTVDFMTEAGTFDVFILPGGSFKDAVANYVQLTGPANLPPLYAMGYHQSRYGYLSQEELLSVANGLQDGDFPVDVVWLDIDYTNGKRYFTWDYDQFADPMGMQYRLEEMSMRLVTIIDPHIKVDTDYPVFKQLEENGYYVMNPNGSRFEGNCWPGLSSWVDFINPNAVEWWSSLFDYDFYENTTHIVDIWNDMNEPSVFDTPDTENTMSGDLLHYGNISHREVHNAYGYMQTKGTYEGLLARNYIKQRPFVLTRSHYAGSQRYTAIWTGDNVASWEHLRVSIPICLSEALAGISFCGADVGGFNDFPSDELFQRWYQLGAWYPFFRAHCAGGEHREPYLYPEEIQTRFRNAIKQRYAHLPFWYTRWFEHEQNGEPVMRPLIYNYPNEAQLADIDTEFMIGDDILIAPVLFEGAEYQDVVLPQAENWFYFQHNVPSEYLVFPGGEREILVDMDITPVFYRAGSIIPRKDSVKATSKLMKDEPFDLYIFAQGREATGTLYDDDTESFDYRNQVYTYLKLRYLEDTIVSEVIDSQASYDGKFTIGNIYLHYDADDVPHHYNFVTFHHDGVEEEFSIVHYVNMLQLQLNVEIRDKNFYITFKH